MQPFINVEDPNGWPTDYCASSEMAEANELACEFCYGENSEFYMYWWCDEPGGSTGFYCTGTATR